MIFLFKQIIYLVPKLSIGVEQTADCACACLCAACLYAARRHAAVFALNYDYYVLRSAYLLHDFRNIGANALLQLQALAYHIAYACYFR